MISQYSKPRDIIHEFWNDHEKARYWLMKKTSGSAETWKIIEDGFDVLDGKRQYKFSEPIFYTSPQTGNRWMLFICSRRDESGVLRQYSRTLLFQLTERYMTVMLPTYMADEDKETGELKGEIEGVNVYTSHLFQRMADPDRLGVDMSDRFRVMRNFSEFVATGWCDTRDPREGEKHQQIMLRTPGSWLRGHVVMVGSRYVSIYRTFYTDKSMSFRQWKDVKTFRKFADAKKSDGNRRSGETALLEPTINEMTKGLLKPLLT